MSTSVDEETQQVEVLGFGESDIPNNIDEVIDKSLTQNQTQYVIQFQNLISGQKVIDPPYNPLKLTALLEQNTRLNRAVTLRARNTVGLGYYFVPKPEFADSMTEEEIKAESKELRELLSTPNRKIPFIELMTREKIDEEATGTGYIEIARNRVGKIAKLFHLPAHTVRIVKQSKDDIAYDDEGNQFEIYVQFRNGKKIFFKEFGDPRKIDSSTGKKAKGNIGFEKQANEVIKFTIYSARSTYYGIPRWIAAIAAIQGNRMASLRNMAFFENDAVGRLAIMVTGGRLSQESLKLIESFAKKQTKGAEKAHRVMVLQTEPKKVLGGRGNETKIELKPLTVGATDDASFQKYRILNDNEVQEASGLSEPFFTAAGLNKATATLLRKITIDQELKPDLESHEYIFNMTVVPEFTKKLLLKFVAPDAMDSIEKTSLEAVKQKSGVSTLNESRRVLGAKPFEQSEFEYGDMPLPFALIKMQTDAALGMGAFGSTGGKPSENAPNPSRQAQEVGNAGQAQARLQMQKDVLFNSIQEATESAYGIRDVLKEFGRDISKIEIELLNGEKQTIEIGDKKDATEL